MCSRGWKFEILFFVVLMSLVFRQVSQDDDYLFSSSGNVVKVFSIKDGAIKYKLQTEEEDQIAMFVLNPVTQVCLPYSIFSEMEINNHFSFQNLVTVTKNFIVREWAWRESKCLKTWKVRSNQPNLVSEASVFGACAEC